MTLTIIEWITEKIGWGKILVLFITSCLIGAFLILKMELTHTKKELSDLRLESAQKLKESAANYDALQISYKNYQKIVQDAATQEKQRSQMAIVELKKAKTSSDKHMQDAANLKAMVKPASLDECKAIEGLINAQLL